MIKISALAAFAGATLLMAGGTASAGVIRFDPALKTTSSPMTDVQFRGGGHGPRIHGGFGHRGGFGRGGFGRGGFGHPRFGHGGFGRGGFGYHRGYGYRHGYRRGYGGLGVGAGLAGFAAGAALGSTLAPGYGYGAPAYAYDAAPAVATGDSTAYCQSRFRSYDPATGTYTGYDGLKHACP